MCNSNRSAPLLIWKHANYPMQTYILSSHHVSPRHIEQQLHHPPRSYVVIVDPVIASDSLYDQPVAASLSAMHHGMFTLQANYPPAILNCPPCAPQTVRPNLSIIGRLRVSCSTLTLSACHLTLPILSTHWITIELLSVVMCTTTEHCRHHPLVTNEPATPAWDLVTNRYNSSLSVALFHQLSVTSSRAL
jgi:hypothetical protein